ncbi:MAG: hypothetical protein GY934_21970 [Gammaproteobacteria bacterium]|nr:hypothetical protein [Gammaproteobacteria bacterium]
MSAKDKKLKVDWAPLIAALDELLELVPGIKGEQAVGAIKVLLAQEYQRSQSIKIKKRGRPKKINFASKTRESLLICTINEIKEENGIKTDSEAVAILSRQVKDEGVTEYRGVTISKDKVARDLQNFKRDGRAKRLDKLLKEKKRFNPDYKWADLALMFERIYPHAEELDEIVEDILNKAT